jgi:hypothetical protein
MSLFWVLHGRNLARAKIISFNGIGEICQKLAGIFMAAGCLSQKPNKRYLFKAQFTVHKYVKYSWYGKYVYNSLNLNLYYHSHKKFKSKKIIHGFIDYLGRKQFFNLFSIPINKSKNL